MKVVLCCCILVFLIVKDSDGDVRAQWGRGGKSRWSRPSFRSNQVPVYRAQKLRVFNTPTSTTTSTTTTSTTTARTTTTTTTTTPPPQPTAAVKEAGGNSLYEHRNARLLPTESCGKQSTIRIVNGENAYINQFPWLVFLVYQGVYRCGGSLISSRYVLSAAHCNPGVVGYPHIKLVSVILGEHDLRSDPDCDELVCATSRVVAVEEQIVSPLYLTESRAYDIMLVRLAESVQFQDNIVPICLPMNEAEAKVYDDEYFLVAGWGLTEKNKYADVKQIVEVAHMGAVQCKDSFPITLNPALHICAGGLEDHKDSCNGDSGGPLVSVRKVNGEDRYMALGVLSGGPPRCGTVGIPGLYSKIFPNMQWILDTMRP